jgi:hypothetical protein
MTKKHFIALADAIRAHQGVHGQTCNCTPFTEDQLQTLAAFCREQNSNFNRDRWLGYIRGENGPSGGKVERVTAAVARKAWGNIGER